MALDTSNPPRPAAWEAEQLRITTFHPLNVEESVLSEWWESITGEKPEQQSARPREGMLQMSGLLQENQLVVATQQGQVNALLLPPPQPLITRADGLPTLGLLPSALDALRSLAPPWLTLTQPITRLAFGAVLVNPVPDLLAGHRFISQYLPFDLDESNISDFFYQINRPRKSKDEQMDINRLTRWSVAQGGIISFAIGLNEATRSYSDVQFVCRLELDINTQANRTTPINDELPLFKEMIEYAEEIAQKGDIP